MNSSITVTFNPDIECLKLQFDSIKRQQIDICIIVDNGSHNVSEIEDLTEQFNFTFIKLGTNYGLAYAQNVGIESAIFHDAKYILLLDQDSILKEKFVENLKRVYLKYDVGILGASFYDPTNGRHYPGTSFKGPFIHRVAITEITDVTFVIASGSFFSTDVFKKIGGMKEELFVDYIDVEWSLRAKKFGYRVAMTDEAVMAHTIGDTRMNLFGRTISVHSPLRRYYLVRNSFLMLRLRYVPFGYKLRELVFNVIRTCIGFLTSEHKVVFCKYVLMAFRDGVLGRSGPCPKIYK